MKRYRRPVDRDLVLGPAAVKAVRSASRHSKAGVRWVAKRLRLSPSAVHATLTKKDK